MSAPVNQLISPIVGQSMCAIDSQSSRGSLFCQGRVDSSCSTSGTRRVPGDVLNEEINEFICWPINVFISNSRII